MLIQRLVPVGMGYLDNAGGVLAGGSIEFYENGTTTLATVYSDAAGTSATSNPMTLDGAGRPTTEVFGHPFNKMVVKDSSGVAITEVEQVDTAPSGVDGAGNTYLTRSIYGNTQEQPYLFPNGPVQIFGVDAASSNATVVRVSNDGVGGRVFLGGARGSDIESTQASQVNDIVGQYMFAATGAAVLDGGGVDLLFPNAYMQGRVANLTDPLNPALDIEMVTGGFRAWVFSNDRSFYPVSDNAQDLGKSDKRVDDIYATNTTIQSSDSSLKTNVVDSTLGLSFLKQLRPVEFTWADTPAQIDEFTGEELVPARSYNRTHNGLISQEVKAVLDGLGIDRGMFIDPDDGPQGIRYGELTAIIIKALQEIDARLTAVEP